MRIKAGTSMKTSDNSALTLTQLTKKMLFSKEVTKCTVSVSHVIKYIPTAFGVSGTIRDTKHTKIASQAFQDL